MENDEFKKTKSEVSKLRLNDLNVDVLIKIFRYLSMNDLVRIVDYDDYFVTAAQYVFAQRFGKKKLNIDKFWYRKSDMIRKRTLIMLNHFGEVITKAEVAYECLTEPSDAALADIIINKFGESLLEVTFHGTNRSTSKLIGPFKNVETVSFEHGESCYLISEFNKWFPKAKTLKLHEMKLEEHEKSQLLQKYYPTVEHFVFIESGRPCVDIKLFAELNPQIKSLSLSSAIVCPVVWRDIFEAIAKIPSLQSLKLLERSYPHFTWMPWFTLSYTINGKIVNIFKANGWVDATNLIILVTKWSDLKELIFPYRGYNFESLDIINAVFECQSLQKFIVGYENANKYTIHSENYVTVKSALDDAVAGHRNKCKCELTFDEEWNRRFDYLIKFERIEPEVN